METITRPLVKVTKILDSRYGQIGEVIDDCSGTDGDISIVRFSDYSEVPFRKDEIEEFRGTPCPRCIGEGDLADIATLVARGIGISVEKIGADRDLAPYDAVLITDMDNPQSVYDNLKTKVKIDRLLFLSMLHISRNVDC